MTPIQALIVEVRALATKYPNAVYLAEVESGPCWYTKIKPDNTDDTCGEGCIFGQAAKALPDDNPLKALILSADNEENLLMCRVNYCKSPSTIRRLLNKAIEFCQEINWCNAVQTAQDCKMSWSASVTRADEICPLP